MSITDALEDRMHEMTLKTESNDTNGDGEKWGLPLKELYRLALNFYKDQSGKAIHLSYEDNLKLVAFTQQTTHGPLDYNKAPPLGVLDVIGKDRRLAWLQLGEITRAQAMEGFITLLDRLCPLFKPYVEAIKQDREEKFRKAKEEELRRRKLEEEEKLKLEEEKKLENEKNYEEVQKRQLQDALNQQTYNQFKVYAEKQYPGNPEQQALLIRQLQIEHYHQYMQQLKAQFHLTNENTFQRIDSIGKDKTEVDTCPENEDKEQDNTDTDNESGEYCKITAANMWTKPDIKQFKHEVASGKGDGVIKVGHGDVVTVRVPTHDGGSCFFWEFATDNYDIGFGVYFEWGKPMSNEVSVHVSESDDEEDPLDDDDITSADDLESGGEQKIVQTVKNRPPISIIVPVYRRECQNEVYAGSHSYPGEGVYLLKFDNSYSIWRSKTLYYKIFYTR